MLNSERHDSSTDFIVLPRIKFFFPFDLIPFCIIDEVICVISNVDIDAWTKSLFWICCVVLVKEVKIIVEFLTHSIGIFNELLALR